MMKTPARHARRNLVEQLMKQPMLPAYIEALPSPVFSRLIQYLGKEDSQELLACATDAQVQELIEADVWHNPKPGTQERFDPARFLEWLQIWQDMRPAFLVAKLKALGSDTLALALDRYVVVVDLEEVGVSDYVETYYPYGVMPRIDESWELIVELLAELCGQEPELLQEVLAQCCMRRSLLVDKTYIAGNDTLEHNVNGRRDRHRREGGYLCAMDAAAFLRDARVRSLDQLMLDMSYDPLSALHLDALRRRPVSQTRAKAYPQEDAAAHDDSAPSGKFTPAMHELDALLLQHNIVAKGSMECLLTRAGEQDALYLRRQMRVFSQKNPSALEDRQHELAYLANVLLEGMPVQGGRLTEALALQGALALCNLGLEYCVCEEPWGTEEEVVDAFLQQPPGFLKAFRIGLHLITDLPGQVARLLATELRSAQNRRGLRDLPWIREQAIYALTKFALHGEEQGASIDTIHALLDDLLFMLDNTACQHLRVIADSLPCVPHSLRPGAVPGVQVDKRWQFIETLQDLQQLRTYLKKLEGHLIQI